MTPTIVLGTVSILVFIASICFGLKVTRDWYRKKPNLKLKSNVFVGLGGALGILLAALASVMVSEHLEQALAALGASVGMSVIVTVLVFTLFASMHVWRERTPVHDAQSLRTLTRRLWIEYFVAILVFSAVGLILSARWAIELETYQVSPIPTPK